MVGLTSAILTGYLPKPDQLLAAVQLSWQGNCEVCGQQLNTGGV